MIGRANLRSGRTRHNDTLHRRGEKASSRTLRALWLPLSIFHPWDPAGVTISVPYRPRQRVRVFHLGLAATRIDFKPRPRRTVFGAEY
jgi:hypothetical protein